MPNGRCKFHGGMSLVGPAHPNWKDGRHSKYLPKDLIVRYREARSNPALLELRDDLALVDTRVTQLLGAIGETGNARLWKEAAGKLAAFKQSGSKGKAAVGAARVALQELEDVLAAGLQASATWDELRETLELRRKLNDSETKRMKDLHQMISAERAWAMLGLLVDVVREHVTDRNALAAISDQYRRLVGGSGGEPPAAQPRAGS